MIDKNKISELIYQHDIYIQTNRIENMPVSILEMWACGIPIVVTKVGGISHLCNNEIDSIVVKSEDPISMSQQCIRLINNNTLAERLSNNGRQKVKEFTNINLVIIAGIRMSITAWLRCREGHLSGFVLNF